MRVIRAKTAGFCMGVSLALNKLDQTLGNALASKPLVMLGPIIHNPQVLADYDAQGVLCAESLADIPHGSTVIIRAHGLPIADENQLRKLGMHLVDATCPKVKKAQLAIAAATAHGQSLLLFGEEDHPEVRGLVSYAQGACHVFAHPDELPDVTQTDSQVLAAQTTQDFAAFAELAEQLKKRCPNLIVLSTICNATSCRQEEAIAIAKQVDMVIVVGGKDSGNTRRLAQVAEMTGTVAQHIETLADLKPLPPGIHRIGLTAGASTPKNIIDDVQNFLEHVLTTPPTITS